MWRIPSLRHLGKDARVSVLGAFDQSDSSLRREVQNLVLVSPRAAPKLHRACAVGTVCFAAPCPRAESAWRKPQIALHFLRSHPSGIPSPPLPSARAFPLLLRRHMRHNMKKEAWRGKVRVRWRWRWRWRSRPLPPPPPLPPVSVAPSVPTTGRASVSRRPLPPSSPLSSLPPSSLHGGQAPPASTTTSAATTKSNGWMGGSSGSDERRPERSAAADGEEEWWVRRSGKRRRGDGMEGEMKRWKDKVRNFFPFRSPVPYLLGSPALWALYPSQYLHPIRLHK